MSTYANAEPEKRLFISLLTRDISLIDAILDLIDNSINSAIISTNTVLKSAADYIGLLERNVDDSADPPLPQIAISINDESFSVTDTCGGISFDLARDHVFRFGRSSGPSPGDEGDRLSVYGIGLKRAIFKIGDHVQIRSRHKGLGFSMDLRVRAWGGTPQERWAIPITPVEDAGAPYGTEITVTDLFPEIKRRISGGTVASDLASRIGRTYAFFLNRVVQISVNGNIVSPIDLAITENAASKHFDLDGASCFVIAGIGVPQGKFHTNEVAGWYVFCNGRAVAFADKTEVTGWGIQLPLFQPKHRPFRGIVFFTATDPEILPWNTTKSAIDRESSLWQHALTIMGSVGRQVTSFLDSRYSEDGTEITVDELREVAGAPRYPLKGVTTQDRAFTYKKSPRTDTSIQFRVLVKSIDEVRSYLGRKGMSNSEVGRYTFDYFIDNVVSE